MNRILVSVAFVLLFGGCVANAAIVWSSLDGDGMFGNLAKASCHLTREGRSFYGTIRITDLTGVKLFQFSQMKPNALPLGNDDLFEGPLRGQAGKAIRAQLTDDTRFPVGTSIASSVACTAKMCGCKFPSDWPAAATAWLPMILASQFALVDGGVVARVAPFEQNKNMMLNKIRQFGRVFLGRVGGGNSALTSFMVTSGYSPKLSLECPAKEKTTNFAYTPITFGGKSSAITTQTGYSKTISTSVAASGATTWMGKTASKTKLTAKGGGTFKLVTAGVSGSSDSSESAETEDKKEKKIEEGTSTKREAVSTMTTKCDPKRRVSRNIMLTTTTESTVVDVSKCKGASLDPAIIRSSAVTQIEPKCMEGGKGSLAISQHIQTFLKTGKSPRPTKPITNAGAAAEWYPVHGGQTMFGGWAHALGIFTPLAPSGGTLEIRIVDAWGQIMFRAVRTMSRKDENAPKKPENFPFQSQVFLPIKCGPTCYLDFSSWYPGAISDSSRYPLINNVEFSFTKGKLLAKTGSARYHDMSKLAASTDVKITSGTYKPNFLVGCYDLKVDKQPLQFTATRQGTGSESSIKEEVILTSTDVIKSETTTGSSLLTEVATSGSVKLDMSIGVKDVWSIGGSSAFEWSKSKKVKHEASTTQEDGLVQSRTFKQTIDLVCGDGETLFRVEMKQCIRFNLNKCKPIYTSDLFPASPKFASSPMERCRTTEFLACATRRLDRREKKSLEKYGALSPRAAPGKLPGNKPKFPGSTLPDTRVAEKVRKPKSYKPTKSGVFSSIINKILGGSRSTPGAGNTAVV